MSKSNVWLITVVAAKKEIRVREQMGGVRAKLHSLKLQISECDMRKIMSFSAVLAFLAALFCSTASAQTTLRQNGRLVQFKCPTLDLGFCRAPPDYRSSGRITNRKSPPKSDGWGTRLQVPA